MTHPGLRICRGRTSRWQLQPSALPGKPTAGLGHGLGRCKRRGRSTSARTYRTRRRWVLARARVRGATGFCPHLRVAPLGRNSPVVQAVRAPRQLLSCGDASDASSMERADRPPGKLPPATFGGNGIAVTPEFSFTARDLPSWIPAASLLWSREETPPRRWIGPVGAYENGRDRPRRIGDRGSEFMDRGLVVGLA
jgi:hypothetical protein